MEDPSEGDVVYCEIFLHFGECRIRVSDNLEHFKKVADRIQSMTQEIAETYPYLAAGEEKEPSDA